MVPSVLKTSLEGAVDAFNARDAAGRKIAVRRLRPERKRRAKGVVTDSGPG